MRNMFLEAFKTEHSLIFEDLLSLKSSLPDRDSEKLAGLLEHLDEIMGLHFMVEEEVLYPALGEYFTRDYINKLIEDHDLAFNVLTTIKQGLSSGKLTGIPEIENMLQQLLSHITSCDGLSLVIEKLPRSKIDELDTRMHMIWLNAKPLTQWRKPASSET